MASRLKEKNAHGTNINFFRTREQEFLVYFDKKNGNGNFVYYQDMQGILERMGVEEYLLGGWRLFAGNNKRSLKCI